MHAFQFFICNSNYFVKICLLLVSESLEEHLDKAKEVKVIEEVVRVSSLVVFFEHCLDVIPLI